jgi:hypothetical protein
VKSVATSTLLSAIKLIAGEIEVKSRYQSSVDLREKEKTTDRQCNSN